MVSENARVHAAVLALKTKDVEELGRLFIESHKSMRDDYEVSIPEIDLLVDLCLLEKEVFGARLTGGGFGGSVVVLTKKGEKDKVAMKVIRTYNSETKEKAVLLA